MSQGYGRDRRGSLVQRLEERAWSRHQPFSRSRGAEARRRAVWLWSVAGATRAAAAPEWKAGLRAGQAFGFHMSDNLDRDDFQCGDNRLPTATLGAVGSPVWSLHEIPLRSSRELARVFRAHS